MGQRKFKTFARTLPCRQKKRGKTMHCSICVPLQVHARNAFPDATFITRSFGIEVHFEFVTDDVRKFCPKVLMGRRNPSI